MKNTLLILAGASILLGSSICPQKENGFKLITQLEGIQAGDTLLLGYIELPVWADVRYDTLITGQKGNFSGIVPLRHTSFMLMRHLPKAGKEIQSCIRGAEIVARPGDEITLKGTIQELGAVRHSGGLYNDSVVNRYDSLNSSHNLQLIGIYTKILEAQKNGQNDSVNKYGQMYNHRVTPEPLKQMKEYLEKENTSEYAAFHTASSMYDHTYESLQERLSMFSPEIQATYFGQIMKRQLGVLKNIAVDNTPPPFTLTDKEGNKLSLSDYKGKYLLIYHWGICPGTFWVNPQIEELYEKYHSKGLEILGLSQADITPWYEEIKQTEPDAEIISSLEPLLKHSWRTAFTSKEGNGFIVDSYYLSGVPILMLISPQGKTLVRGYSNKFEEVKKVLEEQL